MAKKRNLFQRLNTIFRSGPIVKRKIQGKETASVKSSAFELFKKSTSNVYGNALNSYGQYDRLSRYADFCVSGNTKIATNTKQGWMTIKEMSKRFSDGEKLQVFSYDKKSDSVVCADVTNAWMTKVEEIIEIEFDKGLKLHCTKNHPIMMRDGSYRRADELCASDAVMPFYRKKFNKTQKSPYRYIYSFSRGWKPEHCVVGEYKSGLNLDKSSGLHVHHENFDAEDNRVENLQIMTQFDHLSLHAKINNKRFENPKEKEKQSLIMKKRWDTGGDLRENIKASTQKRMSHPSWSKNLDRLAEYDKTVKPGKFNAGRIDQKGSDNANADKSLTFQTICNAYQKEMTFSELSKKLSVSKFKINNRLKWEGYKSFYDFEERYENHKVVAVRELGIKVPVYDLTVDKYHNFAICDEKTSDGIVFVHNSEMEYEPILARSLSIYSEEAVAKDAHGRSLHIYSDNPKIQSSLEELFYDTLNWEFVGPTWVRDLCKYGDYFLMIDVSERHGVINVMPIPVNEIEREEGFDPNDPFAVRFRWVTQGNQVLENWQVSHFRLSGNDAFLPYGSSIIEPARRIWRQLVLAEDAMLVYRVIRSPERRVFYIDIGNTAPNDIPNVIEQARSELKSQVVTDKNNGRTDLRYNPWSVDIDYFLPVRGTETGTRIDTLPGGQNTTAIDDVEYILNKLFTAVGVPKPYLNYSEGLSSKANLAQEDVRFARTVNQIQQIVISELNKIAAIHLAAHGYDGEDLIDFKLQLSNPSTMAVQQQLELVRTRFEIAATKPEQISDNFVYKKVFFMTDQEILEEEENTVAELRRKAALEEIGGGGGDDGGFGGGGGGGDFGSGEDFGTGEDFGDFGDEEGDLGADLGDEGGDAGGDDIEDDDELFAGEEEEEGELLLDNEDETIELGEDESSDTPVKQRSQVSRVKHNRQRHVNGSGRGYNAMPDIAKMLHHNNDSFKPEDERWKNQRGAVKETTLDIDGMLDRHIQKIEEMDKTSSDINRIDRDLESRIKSLRTNKRIEVKPKTVKGTIIKESDSTVDVEIYEDNEE